VSDLKPSKVEKFFGKMANAFPIWVILGSGLALWEPATATWFQPTWIPFFLGVIMLSMGLTLSYKDFLRILEMPRAIFIGVGLQYIIMPVLGYTVSKIYNLPMDFMIGLVLVSCCPGGTASNVICYIAKLNVALSVSMTTCSTLLAVIMTPLLTTWMVTLISEDLAGAPIQVNTMGLLISTFQVVILPVAAGIALNHFFPRQIKKVTPYTPLLAIFSIVFIVDFILAAKKNAILESGLVLVLAVLTLHLLGFLLGYFLARFASVGDQSSRTISVEVGMQNSGLATELARSNFSSFGLATVPGAISALTHCILGSIFAGASKIISYRDNIDETQSIEKASAKK
jgi:BASS family bile acid:Na+ symporter